MTISLGGGHNVLNLAKLLSTSSLQDEVTLVSPSELTRLDVSALGLVISKLQNNQKIDLAFDGSDSVDYQLNALKSKGGIHLFEKFYAQNAAEYVLITPPERITKTLNSEIFLAVEIATPLLFQVLKQIRALDLKAEIKLAKEVMSYARTPLGNSLISVYANNWDNIDKINTKIEQFNGVVSTSYFHNLVTSVITLDDNGNAIELKKGDL